MRCPGARACQMFLQIILEMTHSQCFHHCPGSNLQSRERWASAENNLLCTGCRWKRWRMDLSQGVFWDSFLCLVERAMPFKKQLVMRNVFLEVLTVCPEEIGAVAGISSPHQDIFLSGSIPLSRANVQKLRLLFLDSWGLFRLSFVEECTDYKYTNNEFW